MSEIVYCFGPFICAYCGGTMGRTMVADGKKAIQCIDKRCEMFQVKLTHPVHKLERIEVKDK